MKIWNLIDVIIGNNKNDTYRIWTMCLEQTIEGHVHSVWDLDCTADYLVTGSADKSIRVWKNGLNGGNTTCLSKLAYLICILFIF